MPWRGPPEQRSCAGKKGQPATKAAPKFQRSDWPNQSRNLRPPAESTAIAARLKATAITAVTANREVHMVEPSSLARMSRVCVWVQQRPPGAGGSRLPGEITQLFGQQIVPCTGKGEINQDSIRIDDCRSASSMRKTKLAELDMDAAQPVLQFDMHIRREAGVRGKHYRRQRKTAGVRCICAGPAPAAECAATARHGRSGICRDAAPARESRCAPATAARRESVCSGLP